MEGVIASTVRLRTVSIWCRDAWQKLKDWLWQEPAHYEIGLDTSAVFVVNQAGNQQGLLVASSHHYQFADPPEATDAPQSIVAWAARSMLKKYKRWDADELIKPENNFALVYNQSTDFILSTKDYFAGSLSENLNGFQVATSSIVLDFRTRWLVVVVMPAGATYAGVESTKRNVEQVRDNATRDFMEAFAKLHVFNVATFVCMTVICIFLGVALSSLVSRDLRSLSALMRQLGKLDFSSDAPEFWELLSGRRSFIADVHDLQDAFCRLANTVKVFAHFVPEAVVRNIVQGHEDSMGLYVRRREVTIMFSDIRGFTTISESLGEADLLYLMTAYLTEMIRVVESYGGVVTEILGDGMLAFWNTPDDVEDHASMACAAAIKQQEALQLLNVQFAKASLPELSVRIGLHTGTVLSGNLGGEAKMKFGCVGDAVNLASRLEGLCKRYSVGIICSGSTVAKLNPDKQFLYRSLDNVQVLGRKEPTWIYQVIGYKSDEDSSIALQVQLYQDALQCFHRAEFPEAEDKLLQLLQTNPWDHASVLLLERVRQGAAEPMRPSDGWSGVAIMTEK